MGGRVSMAMMATARAVAKWRVLLVLAALYLYAFPYFGALRSANELPRIETTVELATHGTFCIDDRMSVLGSVADISTTPAGRRYQNKAPGLAILGVPPYLPLSLGFSVAGREPPLALTTWLLRVLVVTLPSVAFLGLFVGVTRRFAATREARGGALVAYAFGSMALPYALLFMSHALAAAAIGSAFALAIRVARDETAAPLRTAAAVGALLGLATLIEYQAVFAAAIVFGYVVLRSKRRTRVALVVAAAAAPFAAALLAYHAVAFGAPLRSGYAYSVDKANRVGFMGVVGFSKASLSQLFVRVDNGLLLLSPWVVLSIVGGVAIARDREARARVGAEAIVSALVVTVYCAFVALLDPEFGRGGWSVGPRYLAVAMPFFAWLAAAGLDVCVPRPGLRIPAFALVLVGVVVHVLAATTYPHWPETFENPIFEVSLRLLREGHAPHSLGTLVGLRGILSLLPLYVAIVVVVARLICPTRRLLLELVLAAVIAGFTVSRYERLAITPKAVAATSWRFVVTTLEP